MSIEKLQCERVLPPPHLELNARTYQIQELMQMLDELDSQVGQLAFSLPARLGQ